MADKFPPNALNNHTTTNEIMRIWDLPPKILCTKHLLGEHRELHTIWTIIIKKKKGYENDREVQRWIGKTKSLYLRHEALVKEMLRRGHLHRSQLDERLASGESIQRTFINSPLEQRKILQEKKCKCIV